MHPASETTGEQKYQCTNDIPCGFSVKILLSISETTYSNLDHGSFSVLLLRAGVLHAFVMKDSAFTG